MIAGKDAAFPRETQMIGHMAGRVDRCHRPGGRGEGFAIGKAAVWAKARIHPLAAAKARVFAKPRHPCRPSCQRIAKGQHLGRRFGLYPGRKRAVIGMGMGHKDLRDPLAGAKRCAQRCVMGGQIRPRINQNHIPPPQKIAVCSRPGEGRRIRRAHQSQVRPQHDRRSRIARRQEEIGLIHMLSLPPDGVCG